MATVEPGSQFGSRLVVANYSDRPIEVSLTTVAAEATGGAFTLREDVRTPLLDWMTVVPASLRLEPGAQGGATVQFAVPEGAPRGEQLASVLAAVQTSEGSVGVVSRVGVRVYLTVGEGGTVGPNFSIVEARPGRDEAGVAYLDVALENTGGPTIDIVGDVGLSADNGLRVDPVAFTPVTLRPGDRAWARTTFPEGLTAGPWTARIVARSGLLERVATATVTFPSVAGDVADPVPAEIEAQRRLLIPISIALILALLIGLYVAWRAQRLPADVRTAA